MLLPKKFWDMRLWTVRLGALLRQPVFWIITIIGHVFIALGAALFFWFEHDENPGVSTFLEAVFWAVSTITTVGYGDIVPVTTAGRLVAIAMMLLGSLYAVLYTTLFVAALIAPELKIIEDEVADFEKKFTDRRK